MLVQTVGSPLLRHFYLPGYFLHVLVQILFLFLRHGHLDLRLFTSLHVLGFVATGSPFPHRNVPFLPGCIPSVVHMLICPSVVYNADMMLSMRFPTTCLIDITRSLFRFTSKILSCHSLCKMILHFWSLMLHCSKACIFPQFILLCFLSISFLVRRLSPPAFSLASQQLL